MARKPRLYVEGCAQHVVQRGNNRSVCFFADADYAFYMACLREAAEKYAVAVHAFVLMTNHVHMLVTPSTREGVSRMMQAIGRAYVRYINITYKRTGSLWEGRFKSCLVASDRYLVQVMRYIELNPVRARMVEEPCAYPWSSFRCHGMGVDVRVLTPHACYLALGETQSARMIAYRALFNLPADGADVATIRDGIQNEWVVGSKRFCEEIAAAHQRKKKTWGGDRKSQQFKNLK